MSSSLLLLCGSLKRSWNLILFILSASHYFQTALCLFEIPKMTSMSVESASNELESTVIDDITGQEDNCSDLRKVASSSKRVVTNVEELEDMLYGNQEEVKCLVVAGPVTASNYTPITSPTERSTSEDIRVQLMAR